MRVSIQLNSPLGTLCPRLNVSDGIEHGTCNSIRGYQKCNVLSCYVEALQSIVMGTFISGGKMAESWHCSKNTTIMKTLFELSDTFLEIGPIYHDQKFSHFPPKFRTLRFSTLTNVAFVYKTRLIRNIKQT